MHNTILITLLTMLTAVPASAQFYTITKDTPLAVEKTAVTKHGADSCSSSVTDTTVKAVRETAEAKDEKPRSKALKTRKCDDKASPADKPVRLHKDYINPPGKPTETHTTAKTCDALPELTIPNLLAEIKKNGIKYPKIVLAQAILETGWFKSSVCRNKHNLFGLTNPRTKTYYEFDHWTESVKAYYTKVQYRYSSGNYLLWLKKIGYAEDKGYIKAVISVLRQLKI